MSSPTRGSWAPPTLVQVSDRSDRLGLGLSAEQIAGHHRLGPLFAAAHHDVARWWHTAHPRVPEIEWSPGNDRWNATEARLNLTRASTGPLAGMTIAVKSTVAIAGVPLAAGSLLVDGHVPDRSATVIDRVLDAGATITHTGRTDDLCLAITGDQSAHGPVLNPWSPAHTTWGSSAGVAALVCAGQVQAGILVDQAGSGRVPGAGCGLIVLMPTRGLIPMTGILGFTTVQDRVAVAARDTATVARLASTLTGADGRDLKQGPGYTTRRWDSGLRSDISGLRIGVVRQAFAADRCDPTVALAVYDSILRLAEQGVDVVEVDIPRYGDAANLAMVLTVHSGVPDLLATNLGSAPSVLTGDPELVRRFATGRDRNPQWLADTARLSASVAGHDGGQPDGYWLATALSLIPELRAAYDEPFHGDDAVDLLVTPTVHTTAPALPSDDMSAEQVLLRALGPGILHTCGLNLTGHPAVQVPVSMVGGLPVGAQLIAPHLGEQRCLDVAAAMQPPGGFPMAGVAGSASDVARLAAGTPVS